jgi:uncharacterized protein (DUF58 family)
MIHDRTEARQESDKAPKRSRLGHFLATRWTQWLARRMPPASSITLSHRSIFILPTKFGLLWLALVLLLYLFGTNYQNNLVIGLSILLFSLLNTCIFYSYRNLAGLTLMAQPVPQAYSGETLSFPIRLSSTHQAFEIGLNFPQNRIKTVRVADETPKTAQVPCVSDQRGWLRPGRLKVESRYPLGLCRAWSHVDLDVKQIVFAEPIATALSLGSITEPSQDKLQQGKETAGVEEFRGLKEHVIGESLKQVAWKQWAQGRGMLTKEFAQPQGEPIWLIQERLGDRELELQLSHLCWQIDKLSETGFVFGLLLGSERIAPGLGEQHRIACQQAVALVPFLERVATRGKP